MDLFENLQLMHENERMTYKYDGPYYRFGNYYGKTKEPLYTNAPSIEKAKTNFIYKLKKLNNLQPYSNLTIDINKIEEVISKNNYDDYKEIKHEPVVNDPKFNFDDDDRNDDYTVESHLDEDFEVNDTNQQYTSAKTSINSNKLPAIFKMINLQPNTINLDYGGGKFDNVAEYYADKNVINLVYDPYNRSSEHNSKVLDEIRKNGGADSVTCSNVLNVIAEPEARETVLKNISNLAKSGAPIYITVYEGSGSGEGGVTKSGYQLNKKTNDYLEEIQNVFPNAKRKGKLIIANK